MIELLAVESLEAPAFTDGPGLVFCPEAGGIEPRFPEPFPVDPSRLLFGETVVPCFGIWNGLDPGRRARLAGQVRLPRWRGADDFVLELLLPAADVRLAVARVPGAGTLADASARIARELKSGHARIRRWLRRDRLHGQDGLRLPVVRARAGTGGFRITVVLGADGPEEPVPERILLGRADAYRRCVECGGPFFLWAGDRRSLSPRLVAHILRP
jgi:hypothetical protein